MYIVHYTGGDINHLFIYSTPITTAFVLPFRDLEVPGGINHLMLDVDDVALGR